eukprot:m.185738 g.185738  ORF g.185738 m.185738 type:complete len:327 (-) comp16546_c0_seq1:100-1080(-)
MSGTPKKGRGFSYTPEEDEWLIDEVLERCSEEGNTVKLGGRVFWMQLATEMPTFEHERTWESLKTRYQLLLKTKTGRSKVTFEDAYDIDHGQGRFLVKPVGFKTTVQRRGRGVGKESREGGEGEGAEGEDESENEDTPSTSSKKYGAKAKDSYGLGTDKAYKFKAKIETDSPRRKSPARSAKKVANRRMHAAASNDTEERKPSRRAIQRQAKASPAASDSDSDEEAEEQDTAVAKNNVGSDEDEDEDDGWVQPDRPPFDNEGLFSEEDEAQDTTPVSARVSKRRAQEADVTKDVAISRPDVFQFCLFAFLGAVAIGVTQLTPQLVQ